MIKRLTLVRRAAGVGSDDFGSRWRRQEESALAAMPRGGRPVRLAHCVVRPGRDQPWDGVAISWHTNLDAAAGHDEWTAAHQPEDSVLDEASTVLEVEERTVNGGEWLAAWWRAQGDAPRLLVIGFIEAAAGFSRERFRDYWWTEHRPLAERLVPRALGPVAYVHNYVRPGQPGPWAGIGELYESSLDTARRRGAWFASDEARPLLADEERFLVPATRQLLITDQQLITTVGASL